MEVLFSDGRPIVQRLLKRRAALRCWKPGWYWFYNSDTTGRRISVGPYATAAAARKEAQFYSENPW